MTRRRLSFIPVRQRRWKDCGILRRIRIRSVLLFFCAGVSAAGALAESMESTLDRLEGNCASFGKPLPTEFRSVGTVLEMNSDWKPGTVTRVEKRIILLDSSRKESIIRAVRTGKDGKEKDITEEVIRNDEKEKKDKSGKSRSMSLADKELFVFMKEMRSQYDFSWLSDSLLDGKPVKRLAAVPKTRDVKRFFMTYAVHPDSMTVLSVDMTPSKNPKMVKQMSMRMRFFLDSRGHYFMKRFWMRVYVNLLIKKIRSEISEDYSDFQYP
jgi:hypothetical protein